LLKLLVADTQPLFSECLASALAMEVDFEVLEERPASGPKAVEAAVKSRPDILVTDYWMPDMGGPAIAAVVGSRTESPVVLLAWLFGPGEVAAALAAGAAAFIPKSVGIGGLADALRRVGGGERPVYPAQLESLAAGSKEPGIVATWGRLSSLTDREIQIVRLMGRGYSKSTIASRLDLSPHTARTHIENIRRKLDARTGVEAVAIARHYGFIPP